MTESTEKKTVAARPDLADEVRARSRGHEKVPTGGQVEVPAGGQIEVPTPCVRRVDPELRARAVTVKVPTSHRHHPGSSIEVCEGPNGHHFRLSEVGTYRGAAEMCGTTHKTVKRVVETSEAGGEPAAAGRAGP